MQLAVSHVPAQMPPVTDVQPQPEAPASLEELLSDLPDLSWGPSGELLEWQEPASFIARSSAMSEDGLDNVYFDFAIACLKFIEEESKKEQENCEGELDLDDLLYDDIYEKV